MNELLEAALQYAGRGWRIIPLWWPKEPGVCACGIVSCRRKHPRIKTGKLHAVAATTDPDKIAEWWRRWPQANVGIVTGVGLCVVDVDGNQGAAKLTELAAAHGALPSTLGATTGREGGGLHLYYSVPAGEPAPQSAGDGLDCRGDGGFVAAPPSRHLSGAVYQWANPESPLGELPGWLLAWFRQQQPQRRLEAPGAAPVAPVSGFGERPAYLAPSRHLAEKSLIAARDAEMPEFLAALREISSDTCGYNWWFIWGAGIHDFDPGEVGLAIFKAWSRSSARHGTEYDDAACDSKWEEYKRPISPGKVLRTKASIYEEADKIRRVRLGVAATSDKLAGGEVNGHKVEGLNGHTFPFNASTAADGPIFVDFTDKRKPQATAANAAIAIQALGVTCRKDVFHEKMIVGGHLIEQWAGDLSDDVIQMLRRVIKREHRLDPGERNTRDAAIQLCLEHQFNPVVEYLDGLEWDGVRRIDTWVSRYMSASDTPFVRAAGRLMLVAAVRRARRPGTKFDQMVVFEGVEGTGKSAAVKILAGEENFSDQPILAGSDREQQEAFTGVWIHEVAELEGMSRADVKRVKQFMSRTEDRARPAYGRIRVDMKRRGIFIGTTNEDTYLKSETGNRRFWPIATGSIDLEGLAADRDMLWAEAAAAEARGESIVLDVSLRVAAAEEQAARLDGDPWHGLVECVVDGAKVVDNCALIDVLRHPVMALDARSMNQDAQNRVARILIKMGFERYRQRDGEKLAWRYRRAGTEK